VPPTTPRRDAGFTISELVLVLVVIAGLIAIIVVSVNGIDDDAAERECRTELRTIKAATERFKAEIGYYPPDDDALAYAAILDQDESPNWRVVTRDEAAGPRFEPEGDRCA
jgi:general secretion pathway protein G